MRTGDAPALVPASAPVWGALCWLCAPLSPAGPCRRPEQPRRQGGVLWGVSCFFPSLLFWLMTERARHLPRSVGLVVGAELLRDQRCGVSKTSLSLSFSPLSPSLSPFSPSLSPSLSPPPLSFLSPLLTPPASSRPPSPPPSPNILCEISGIHFVSCIKYFFLVKKY